MATERLPVQVACRVVDVAESGYYVLRLAITVAVGTVHPPHLAWLTELIRQVHTASRGTYGARRVHAELTLGHGLRIGHGTVELLMRRAGIKGLPGSRRDGPNPRPRPRATWSTASLLGPSPTGCG